MFQNLWNCRKVLALALASSLVWGCAALPYPEVQREFESAMRADEVGAADAFGALAADSRPLYKDVIRRLSDEFVQTLDHTLQPNAYAMRAVAEWRTGRLEAARRTAAKGLQLSNVADSPRDQVLLRMIPALVIDQELLERYRQKKGVFSEQDYLSEGFQANYLIALNVLDAAEGLNCPVNPEGVMEYPCYQRYRILNNWLKVMTGIKNSMEAVYRARDAAEAKLGMDIEQMINQEVAKAPPHSRLSSYMRATR